MSKLLQRLSDPSKSGVYRASRADDIVEATRNSDLRVTRIGLDDVTGKDALLDRVSSALQFPDWFGGNWDALEDCLTDLSWSGAAGHVLLIEGAAEMPGDERGILADILRAAAGWWAERKRPFFAVFIGGEKALPELYREKA